jgi:flagellar hook-basal body complex protein FliE
MNIASVAGVTFQNEVIALRQEGTQQGLTINEESNFSNIMDITMRLFDETSLLEHEAHQYQFDFLTGRTDDMLGVMLAEQRAHTAVTFTTQITSRIMDAYRQIMNLQI